jgi:hypothetical protein
MSEVLSQATLTLDISTCRAASLGMSDLVLCRSDAREHCEFSLPFGGDYFCRHPQNKLIVAHTESLGAADAEAAG